MAPSAHTLLETFFPASNFSSNKPRAQPLPHPLPVSHGFAHSTNTPLLLPNPGRDDFPPGQEIKYSPQARGAPPGALAAARSSPASRELVQEEQKGSRETGMRKSRRAPWAGLKAAPQPSPTPGAATGRPSAPLAQTFTPGPGGAQTRRGTPCGEAVAAATSPRTAETEALSAK